MLPFSYRPSHFRTVELADFIAYADKIVTGIHKYFDKDKSTYQVKRYACQRATVILGLIREKPLFQNKTQPLCNILNDKTKVLDHQAHDLSVIG